MIILNESLFEKYNDNNEQLYREIASQVRKEIVDKYSEDFLYGKCIEASDRIVDLLSKEGIKSTAMEGWVHYDCDEGCTDRDYDEHTWVETEDDYIIDVTATQFNAFMDEDYPDILIQKELPWGYSYVEDNDLEENLTEAKKKRKKKKISQVNPGEAIFKNVKDMQKWVKKRQKGMGYFVHMDCGNMDYNNNMFNKMHGLGDTSSNSTTDGGASDAAPSGGEASVGMGESLKIIPPKKELRDYLTTREIEFIKNNQKLLNNQNWIQFAQELNNEFIYKENDYAILDFLKAALPEIDFSELESLIDIME